MDEPLEAVGEERLVDRRLERPARLGVGHREHEPVAAAAEVEAGLGLDHHRQVVRQAGQRRGLEQLAAERPDRQLDAGLRRELRRPRAARDHEHVAFHALGRSVLEHLDPELLRSTQHFARDGARVGNTVAPAAGRTEHVVDGEARHDRGVDALDRHAERVLQQAPLVEVGEPFLRRREEEVADLAEEAGAERGEELDALAREHDLRRGRELLAHAAHRTRRRAGGELAALRDDDIVGAEQRKLVGDARADRARAGDDYASHSLTMRSTFTTSSSRRPRSGVTLHATAHPGRRAGRAPSSTAPRGREAPAATRAARRRAHRALRWDRAGRDDRIGKASGEARHRAGGAAGEALRDERLRADEDVEAFQRVGLETLPRVCRTPSARRSSPPPPAATR